MADGTFSDVVTKLDQTNRILIEGQIKEGKADPSRFMKEEVANLLIAGSSAKSGSSLLKNERAERVDDVKQQKIDLRNGKRFLTTDEIQTSFLRNIAINLKNLPDYLADKLKPPPDPDDDDNDPPPTGPEPTPPQSAADTEKNNKKTSIARKTLSSLQNISKGFGKLFGFFNKILFKPIASGAKSLFKIFSGLFGGIAAIGALSFLQSGRFDEVINFIKKNVVPIIGPLIENIMTFGNDVLISLGKFFGGKDMKKAMTSMKEGRFLDGITEIFTAATKKGGLFDLLLTDVANIFLRALGKSELGKGIENTLFNVIEKLFIEQVMPAIKTTAAKIVNLLIEAVNSILMTIPKFARPKLLNKLDPNFEEIIGPREAATKQAMEENAPKLNRLRADLAEAEAAYEEANPFNKYVVGVKSTLLDLAKAKLNDAENQIKKEIVNEFDTVPDKIKTLREEQKKLKLQGVTHMSGTSALSKFVAKLEMSALQKKLSSVAAELKNLELENKKNRFKRGEIPSMNSNTSVVNSGNKEISINSATLRNSNDIIDKLGAVDGSFIN